MSSNKKKLLDYTQKKAYENKWVTVYMHLSNLRSHPFRLKDKIVKKRDGTVEGNKHMDTNKEHKLTFGASVGSKL